MRPHHSISLAGCDLASFMGYLKGLGVFRLVASQKDSAARLAWSSDGAVLETFLDGDGVVSFFLEEYRPTPLVAPWNGGSGFFKKGVADAALVNLEKATNPRLEEYVLAIRAAREALEAIGAGGTIQPSKTAEKRRKAAAKKAKVELVRECRARLPEAALPALDAMVVLTEDRAYYAPLLGSGGNDGNLEFTNNFMQRLLEVLPTTAEAHPPKESRGWLEQALFSEGKGAMRKAAVGQFSPGGMGGPNSGCGFEGESLVNPWDYVLAMEGCAFVAGAATRRLRAGSSGTASFPFAVRVSAAGSASVVDQEAATGRGELWLPVWERSASYAEVRHLFGEARAETGGRMAATGVEFARAVAGLGVDRGVTAFQRFAFLAGQRSGNMYLSVNLGRLPVTARPETGVLREVDGWLGILRSAAAPGAPENLRRVVREVDDAILAFCKYGGASRLQDVISTLGCAERFLAKRHQTARRSDRGAAGGEHAAGAVDRVPPLQGLDANRWVRAADDGSPEFRLAAAVASVGDPQVGPLRCQLEPVAWVRGRIVWADTAPGKHFAPWARKPIWGAGRLAVNLAACLDRRCLEAARGGLRTLPLRGNAYPDLADIAAFLEGRLDEEHITDLIWGLSALDWAGLPKSLRLGPHIAGSAGSLPRAYALMKLLFLPFPVPFGTPEGNAPATKGHGQLLGFLGAGRVGEAVALACRRLAVVGLRPRGERTTSRPDFMVSPTERERLAGALLVPVSLAQARLIAGLVLESSADKAIHGEENSHESVR